MTRHHSRRLVLSLNENVAVMPTPERRNQGIVERLERPIADESGRPARPYRAVDTLGAMERRGSITASMRQAGEDFRARFATAQLDPLRARHSEICDRCGGSGEVLADPPPLIDRRPGYAADIL